MFYVIRSWAPTSLETYDFLYLSVSKIRHKMLTVRFWGFTADLQLFPEGSLKTWIPNYRTANILLWDLWPCNLVVCVSNDLYLASTVSVQIWSKMTIRWQIATTLVTPPPPPPMFIRTTNLFFTVLTDVCLMINFQMKLTPKVVILLFHFSKDLTLPKMF